MTKKQYREIICEQTELIKALKEQNTALKRSCLKLNSQNRRNRLRVIASLCRLSAGMTDECMIPESEVVQMCIEEVKKAYV